MVGFIDFITKVTFQNGTNPSFEKIIKCFDPFLKNNPSKNKKKVNRTPFKPYFLFPNVIWIVSKTPALIIKLFRTL